MKLGKMKNYLNQVSKIALLDDVIDIFFGSPTDKMKLIISKAQKAGRIRDLIYWNNFALFLREGNFDNEQLRKLSELLEEHGNKKMYAISIIKAIDDIDSEEKARCLANLTQSLINSEIVIRKYFRLINTTKRLTGDDLAFLSVHISRGKFLEHEYLDDFLTDGLIRMVDAGYVYTETAWDLMEFDSLRGHDINRPSEIERSRIVSLDEGYDFNDEVFT